MALKAERVDTWVSEIADKPGGAACALQGLADAGLNLDLVIGARCEQCEAGAVLVVAPVKGVKQAAAAKKAGFKKAGKGHPCFVRVEGPDKKGLGAKMTTALAEAKINLTGLEASVLGRKFVCVLMLDKSADATKALRVLKKM